MSYEKKEHLLIKEIKETKEHLIGDVGGTNFPKPRNSIRGSHINKTYSFNINSENVGEALEEKNSISTSKYTFLNCVPKILIEQFSKIANMYFLLIAIMQVSNYLIT